MNKAASMKKLFYILLLVFPLQPAFAQSAEEDAQLALAVEIASQLNIDAPTTLAEAADVIAEAPANVVTAAIARVTSGTSPEVSSAVAAFAAIYNLGVSTADAAAAASVPSSAVNSIVRATLTVIIENIYTARSEEEGGTTNVEDIILAILNDPDFDVDEVLPDASEQDVLDAIVAYIDDNPDLLTDEQLQQLADLGIIASGPQ